MVEIGDSLCKRLLDALISNWPLVAIGIPGIWFGLRTLRDIREQAEATVVAADAAKASADALIDIERAWLVVDMNRFDRPQELLAMARQNSRSVEIDIPFTNYGRTPAWLVEWSRNSMVTNNTDIPLPLNYRTADASPEGSPFPPGEQQRPLNFFVDWTIQNATEITDIQQGRAHLYVYGFVKYRDIFNKMRETYFCLRYYREVPSLGVEHIGWTLAGPPEANRHT